MLVGELLTLAKSQSWRATPCQLSLLAQYICSNPSYLEDIFKAWQERLYLGLRSLPSPPPFLEMVPFRLNGTISMLPPLHPLQDLYIRLHTPSTSFTLNIVTAMYVKRFDQLQHIMLLNHESQNCTLNISFVMHDVQYSYHKSSSFCNTDVSCLLGVTKCMALNDDDHFHRLYPPR